MTLLEGFRVGHWTDREAGTGCTVILCPSGTVASCEVRGASPGSRELALLAPDKKMNAIDALVLTGGSAFGLAAADGVVHWLEERGEGYRTPWGRIPIVPAAVIFDLNVGAWDVRPTAESGYDACSSATNDVSEMGNIGAGCGATVGKWRGPGARMKGGFAVAERSFRGVIVQAIAVVNAVGDIVDRHGKIIAGAKNVRGAYVAEVEGGRYPQREDMNDLTNTTLAAVLTNAALDKRDCFRVSQRIHDGLARSIVPVHTSFDGDVSFVLSHGSADADVDVVAELSADATAEAVRLAVTAAKTAYGIPGTSGLAP